MLNNSRTSKKQPAEPLLDILDGMVRSGHSRWESEDGSNKGMVKKTVEEINAERAGSDAEEVVPLRTSTRRRRVEESKTEETPEGHMLSKTSSATSESEQRPRTYNANIEITDALATKEKLVPIAKQAYRDGAEDPERLVFEDMPQVEEVAGSNATITGARTKQVNETREIEHGKRKITFRDGLSAAWRGMPFGASRDTMIGIEANHRELNTALGDVLSTYDAEKVAHNNTVQAYIVVINDLQTQAKTLNTEKHERNVIVHDLVDHAVESKKKLYDRLDRMTGEMNEMKVQIGGLEGQNNEMKEQMNESNEKMMKMMALILKNQSRERSRDEEGYVTIDSWRGSVGE